MNTSLRIAQVLSLGIALCVTAEESPFFQASLTPNFAIYKSDQRIEGMTLSIWGENPQSGFALGLVNGSSGESAGLSIGIFNYADSYTGLQWGWINYAKGDCTGWQGGPMMGLLVSAVNITGGEMYGVQTGVINWAGKLSGLQLGLVNYARQADSGVQIGLLNIIPENKEWFTGLPNELAPGMIFVNWRF